MAEANLHIVPVDLTRSRDVPQLAEFRPQAMDSLAAARATLTALAGEPHDRAA